MRRQRRLSILEAFRQVGVLAGVAVLVSILFSLNLLLLIFDRLYPGCGYRSWIPGLARSDGQSRDRCATNRLMK